MIPSAPNLPTTSEPLNWIVTNSPNSFAQAIAWSKVSNSCVSELCFTVINLYLIEIYIEVFLVECQNFLPDYLKSECQTQSHQKSLG